METENDRFILTATMYVNDNNIINDDIYEYETIGIPFFASLGKEILSLIEN